MDIIFLTALVLFIFYRLNKELGKTDENESNKIRENIAKKREEILQIKQKIAAVVEAATSRLRIGEVFEPH